MTPTTTATTTATTHTAMTTDAGPSARRTDWRTPLALAAAAIALRLLLFLGRGDYVAFDEGWYLLLGQNLFDGGGYRLSGLRHVALSPLFPILAGALDMLVGDPVWAGRIVAALTSGLVVVPCWFIFRRFAGRRTALLACAFVVVMPSLAPFVAAYWVGADLWVGAEPLLQLLLYTGIAFVLRGLDDGSVLDWTLAGVAFALAYLARPEAALAGALVAGAAGVLLFLRRRPVLALRHGAMLGLAFALVATPYWVYLHDTLGRWALTGRAVSVSRVADTGSGGGDATERLGLIERMLWQDDDDYVETLYALDATGTRLANGYWGLPDELVSDASATPGGSSDTTEASPDSSAAPAFAGGVGPGSDDEPGAGNPIELERD
ncbi:MAG: ArnT family glycosyltransferase, partial [Gemmatimonadota bacterium]